MHVYAFMALISKMTVCISFNGTFNVHLVSPVTLVDKQCVFGLTAGFEIDMSRSSNYTHLLKMLCQMHERRQN